MPNPQSVDYQVTDEEVERYRARGYNDDMLPKTAEKRNMGVKNYFTLWMGSVHNIPNYAAVGGFLFLGLSPINVMFALVVSAVLVAAFMVINGEAGSKYGIPFAMHLRSTYGNLGAKLPGFLRGCVAAIAWFGLQTYTGSLALTIILGKIFPGFLEIGDGAQILGIGIPQLIYHLLGPQRGHRPGRRRNPQQVHRCPLSAHLRRRHRHDRLGNQCCRRSGQHPCL